MSIKNVSFIGLGVMGYPMAGHLQNNGYNVTVYNRTTVKAEKWVEEYKGSMAKTPGEASQNSEIVFMCVGRDEDIIEVMEGESGILSNVAEGSIIVDHTTASAEIARNYYQKLKDKKLSFLDAPVSGGQAGADNGTLTIMAGGREDPFNIACETMSCYSKFYKLMGPSGSGQLTKMVNQICIAGLVQGLAEGINFSQKAGLDVSSVIEVISKGAAQSWQMENRWETMTQDQYDHGFAVDHMRKDLKITIEEAHKQGAIVEITELIDGYYRDIQDMGGNRWDTSSLLKRLQDND